MQEYLATDIMHHATALMDCIIAINQGFQSVWLHTEFITHFAVGLPR